MHSHIKEHCECQGDLASTVGIGIAARVCMGLGMWQSGLVMIDGQWVLWVFEQGLQVCDSRSNHGGQIKLMQHVQVSVATAIANVFRKKPKGHLRA